MIRIGELAKMAGCQAVTIRYYEKEGLLQASERTGSNYRMYDDAQLERLRFIRHCRLLGMNLDEIRKLLAFQDDPRSDCAWVDRLVERHIEAVDAQIASLRQLRSHLEDLRHRCNGGRHEDCGILQSLHENCGCPYCQNLNCHFSKRHNAACPHS